MEWRLNHVGQMAQSVQDYSKNTIIFTHTPKKDWCANESCHKKFVYVSGHMVLEYK